MRLLAKRATPACCKGKALATWGATLAPSQRQLTAGNWGLGCAWIEVQ